MAYYPPAGLSIIFQVGKEMKKVVGALRICVRKKWGGVGIKIEGIKNLVANRHHKNLKGF